jgi:hypothetical protein
MTFFNGAQSFYVDKSVVANSATVDISAISMYFMYRPNAFENRTGSNFPGISMFFLEMSGETPNISDSANIFKYQTRAEWNTIQTSSDASVETVFRFDTPIKITTGKSYAFAFAYDNSEDFLPWTNLKGNDLVGTTQHSTGPSSPYGGHYFLFSSTSTSAANSSSVPTSTDNFNTRWTPLNDTDLKFKIYVARYAVNSIPVFANGVSIPANAQIYHSNLLYDYNSNNGLITIQKPCPRVENITFDSASSLKQAFVGPQKVYQNTVFYPGGGAYATVVSNQSNTITANLTMSNGATFSWNTVFNGYTGDKYIVVHTSDHADVRKISSIVSNTVISLEEATTFSNSASKFMITPVATIDSFNVNPFGRKSPIMFLRDSSANSSVRFTSNSLDWANVAITAGGTGYANTDQIYITGFDYVANTKTNAYAAAAIPTTNSTGGIISLAWSNTGSSFTNTAAMKIVTSNSVIVANNSSANAGTGSGLVLTLPVGSTLYTEQTNNAFRKCVLRDLDIHQVLPVMGLEPVANALTVPYLTTQYYADANGYSRVGASQVFPISLNIVTQINTLNNIPVIVSRSHEFGLYYANGAPNDQVSAVLPYSNTYNLKIATRSLNDYAAVGPFDAPVIDFSRYVFNNDATNENTDSGNAVARHITTVINLSGPETASTMSEDLRVFVSAYRPSGTDILTYARIKNSTDAQALPDGDWTKLTLVEANNYSSSGYTDLSFGFPNQPNTTSIVAGTASTTNASAVLTGSNTVWQTSLAANTLIKIYDPLFANTNYAVCLVTSVASNTSITVDQVFSTNTVFGIGGNALAGRSGLAVDVLGYGHQAFNNPQNHNIVRYYNLAEHIIDGFNIMQIKFVMLSSDAHRIPRIKTIRGLGVSA